MYNRKDYPSSEYTFINPMSKDMRTTRAIQKGLIDPSKPFAQPVRNKDLGIPSFGFTPSPIIHKGGGFKQFFENLDGTRKYNGGGPVKVVNGRIVFTEKPYMPSPAPYTKEQIEKRFGKERAENLEKMFKKFKGKI